MERSRGEVVKRTPVLQPSDNTRIGRKEQLAAVREQISTLRKQLALAQAEERFLQLHLELFPEKDDVPVPEEESGVESESGFDESESESESDGRQPGGSIKPGREG